MNYIYIYTHVRLMLIYIDGCSLTPNTGWLVPFHYSVSVRTCRSAALQVWLSSRKEAQAPQQCIFFRHRFYRLLEETTTFPHFSSKLEEVVHEIDSFINQGLQPFVLNATQQQWMMGLCGSGSHIPNISARLFRYIGNSEHWNIWNVYMNRCFFH